MNIAFDASDLVTGRADGTTRYTLELLRHLPRLGKDHHWHLLAPGHMSRWAKKELDKLPKNVTWHASPWPKFWTQMRLPLELFRLRPDVLFMPIQQLPVIRPWKMKTVAVAHDLAFHLYPEQFTYKNWLLLHVFTAQAVREADDIIAVSEATAQDITHYYGRKKRVHVIH
ncbi:MAG: glycosyltransferase, partial [Acidobacteriota bacterium]